jgi:uncharacterized YigZ family protein
MTETPSYSVPAQNRQVELEIKRSKFLCFAAKANTRKDADDFIRSLREKHPQANHVCWAYIAGSPNTTIRSMSDDGEPSGTAGMPMLKALEYSGYGDIVVVVVRYFGGTKLGTGGLQRAYSDAVSQVLECLPTLPKVSRQGLDLVYDYSFEGVVSRLIERYDVIDVVVDYAEQISVSLAVASNEFNQFKGELVNLTAGRVQIVNSKL